MACDPDLWIADYRSIALASTHPTALLNDDEVLIDISVTISIAEIAGPIEHLFHWSGDTSRRIFTSYTAAETNCGADSEPTLGRLRTEALIGHSIAVAISSPAEVLGIICVVGCTVCADVALYAGALPGRCADPLATAR